MLRTIIYVLLSVVVLTLLRGIIGVITKGVATLFEPESEAGGGGRQATNFGGELKRCATCGTFSQPSAALTVKHAGATHHFCSAACKAKFGETGA